MIPKPKRLKFMKFGLIKSRLKFSGSTSALYPAYSKIIPPNIKAIVLFSSNFSAPLVSVFSVSVVGFDKLYFLDFIFVPK